MKGALPPSSSDTRFTVSMHFAASILPTAVEPVKVNLAMRGSVVSTSPIGAASPVTILSTPLGTPASSPSTASASAENGVSSEGFSTTEQPAASAGPTLRVIMAAGKFQGVTAATTPTGCFRVMIRRSAWWPGITSP
ncbi:hypothetical protein GALL_538670 [mine drainage metagenome]|uniref:Uncharacterized protein n=1 Tax=mine drainage metagenome TaxID=410659 RepID=A0A1J5PM17_9ZZZZ